MRFSNSLLVSSLFGSVVYGATRVFDLELTWGTGAPDGVERYMGFVNGQSPGPRLDINQGDNVEIIVHNNLPFESSIHFHGIEQKGTPWSDGVPGLAQRPIPSGGRFTYRWTATQYGTYWYHSHSRGQIMDGLYGSIQIQPASTTADPFKLISNDTKAQAAMRRAMNNPTMLSVTDWSHFTSMELRDYSTSANIDPICMDSILLNGKGSIQCPGVKFLTSFVPPPIAALLAGEPLTDKGCLPLDADFVQTNSVHNLEVLPPNYFSGCQPSKGSTEVIEADPNNKWININFISSSSVDELTVSIDGHPMYIFAADGLFTQPQLVDAITIPHGSRYAAMIQLNKTPGDYTIRVASSGLNQKLSGYGTLSYTNGCNKAMNPSPAIDYAGVNTTAAVRFYSAAAASPYLAVSPSKTVDSTYQLMVNRVNDAWVWGMNGSSFGVPLEDTTPLLFDPSNKRTNLFIENKNDTWVDLIFIMPPGMPQPSHPMHKHSNRMFQIGQGMGPWNWTTVAEAMEEIPEMFNLVDPPIIDNIYTPPALGSGSWIVGRYHVENPGVFFLHCHINPHLEGGLAMAMIDGPEAFPKIPQEYLQFESQVNTNSDR